MTRRQLSLRLLSITRRVLPPLAASIAARIVFLMIGIALFALGGWAVAGLASRESTSRSQARRALESRRSRRCCRASCVRLEAA